MTKQEIARPYLEKFPDHGDLTLAKLIYKKHPIAFIDVENVRAIVRRLRGHHGAYNLKSIKDKSLFKPTTLNTNPYKLPESEEKEREPFTLPKACNNILLLSDLHIPYHSIDAITAALDYGKKEKINCIVINGDLLDFYMYSKFGKDPRKRSPKNEIEDAVSFLTSLRSIFPHVPIYWIYGNHDIRYETFLKSVAPSLYEDDYYKLEDRMGLAKLKVKALNDKTIIKAGHLDILHGHTIFKMSPQNPAQTAVTRYPSANLLFGHTHKITEFTTNVWDRDKIYTVQSMGCLCELRPEYDAHNVKNSHGFAHVKVEKNGYFAVRNIRLFNGKILG